MLSIKICRKCKDENRWYKWNIDDREQWYLRYTIWCPSAAIGQTGMLRRDVRLLPPEDCPYFLEHMLMNKNNGKINGKTKKD